MQYNVTTPQTASKMTTWCNPHLPKTVSTNNEHLKNPREGGIYHRTVGPDCIRLSLVISVPIKLYMSVNLLHRHIGVENDGGAYNNFTVLQEK